MKNFFSVIKLVIIIFLIFIIHISVSNILPFPFNHINIAYIALFYLIFFSKNEKNIWYFLPLTFLLELFTPIPFGITSFSLFFTIIVINWLINNLFTSTSIPFVSVLFAGGLIIYRVIFLSLSYFINYFFLGENLDLTGWVVNIGMEVGLTSAVAIVFYSILILLGKKLNPKYLI
jgi:hypothetical protein